MPIPASVLNSPKARAEMRAFMKSKGAVAAAHEAAAETPEQLAVLPLWQATATTAKAVHLSPTGAAILSQGPLVDAYVPRRKGWKAIVGSATGGRNSLCGPILRDVEFWHHQSTNGRWNPDLGRFERWAFDPWPSGWTSCKTGRNALRRAHSGALSLNWRGRA